MKLITLSFLSVLYLRISIPIVIYDFYKVDKYLIFSDNLS